MAAQKVGAQRISCRENCAEYFAINPVHHNRTMNSNSQTQFKLKVLFVEDDLFTLNTVGDLLERQGMTVLGVASVPEAVAALAEFGPNVIVTDLDLGPGPDGSDLLNHVHEFYPWAGKVILTAHSSPELAVDTNSGLPADVTFLIKSLATSEDIYEAILNSVERTQDPRNMALEVADGVYTVSKSQAELLRLLADGLSNVAIARKRNRSLAATESLIHRLFTSLGINSDPDVNQRVIAVKMWQQGLVRIK